MANPKRTQAGGFILAVAILAGGLFGALKGEPSAGVVAGIAVGTAIAVAIWLLDRRR